jgi:hypothetical protein
MTELPKQVGEIRTDVGLAAPSEPHGVTISSYAWSAAAPAAASRWISSTSLIARSIGRAVVIET